MPTATATEPLELKRLRIRNFMRIEALDIACDGKHVTVLGKNGRGKTSVAQALVVGINGTTAKETPEPIRRGADEGSIEEVLGAKDGSSQIIVKRTFSRTRGNVVTVIAADGSKIKRPQELLDTFWCEYAIDPVAFLERRPQDQLNDTLAILGVKPPVVDVEKITGEKAPAKEGESAYAYLQRLIEEDRGTYYVRRREAGRVVDQKRDALREQQATVDRLGGPVKAGEQPASAGALLDEIAKLQVKVEERRAALQEAADAEKQRADNATAIERLEKQRGNEATRVRLLEKQLQELKKQIDEGNAGIAALDKRITDGREIVKADAEDAAKLKAAAEAIPDPAPKIAELRQKVTATEQAREAIAARKLATEQLDRLAIETERTQADHKRLDDIVEAIRERRDHLLDGIDIGVEGLSVGDGQLLYNGIPFVQGSLAQRIRVAVALAMRQKPRLRILRLDNAEHLDSESTELVRRLAEEHGYKVFEARVSDDEELKIEIVDADQEATPANGLFREPTAGPYGRA